jgi:phosphopantetheinyl transferase
MRNSTRSRSTASSNSGRSLEKHSAIDATRIGRAGFIDLYLYDGRGEHGSLELIAGALAATTASCAADWGLGYANSGRPIIEYGPPGIARLGISLSHSGSIAVVAISDCATLGVDVEVIRARRYGRIAEYLDWPAIAPGVPADPSPDQFFHLWTLWEASLKTMPDARLLRPAAAFLALAPQTDAGHPARIASDNWHATSWVRPDRFWLTVVTDAPTPNDVRIMAADRPGKTPNELLGPSAGISIGGEELH